MRAANVKINDVLLLAENLLYLLFILLPSMLVSFQLLVLMFAFLSKLRFVRIELAAFLLEQSLFR
jgi:hypothetical protein